MVQYSLPGFTAVADPTRRGILEHLARQDASISELANLFGMTLTGVKKHVAILEDAGLVWTEKVGRVRNCRIGPRRLDDELAWLENYRQVLEQRFDYLERFLEQQKGTI